MIRPAIRKLGALALLVALHSLGQAQAGAPVVASGVVPDEASKAAILERLRQLYGADRVVDRLGVAKVGAPAQWTPQVLALLNPELKQVSPGELRVRGAQVELQGRVASAEQLQKLPDQIQAQLTHPGYQLRHSLSVESGGQAELDAALASRTIEFEPGKDLLTPAGARVLDELLPVLQRFAGRRFEISGHTDSDGAHEANVALSRARAEAVKAYLVQRGVAAAQLITQGYGPDRPLADNASAAGRARNRRIEFRVLA